MMKLVRPRLEGIIRGTPAAWIGRNEMLDG